VPGENVAEQQPADQPWVVPEESGSLGRRAREGRHPYRVRDRHLVEPMRGTGMDGLAAPFQRGQKPPVIKQGRLIAQFLPSTQAGPRLYIAIDRGFRSGIPPI
jgi:hypothetical protein